MVSLGREGKHYDGMAAWCTSLFGPETSNRVGNGRPDRLEAHGSQSDCAGKNACQRKNPPFDPDVICIMMQPLAHGICGDGDGDNECDDDEL